MGLGYIRILTASKVTKQQKFNLSELAVGIYIVRINQQGKAQSLNFILVR